MRQSLTHDAWEVMINRRRQRDRLVQQHMGFARGLAKRLGQTLPPHVDADALESDALLGLLMAARSFDPERGVAFTTYAAKRIHGAMLDGLPGRQGCSRGRRPPVVMSLAKRVLDTDGREVTLGDVLSENQEPVGAALECHEQVEHLLSCVQTTERRMVREYYFDELTQDEIGALHGMSASRVSQRIKAACERMREVACAN